MRLVVEVDLEVLSCIQGTGCLGVVHNNHFVAAAAGIDMRGDTYFPGQKEGRHLGSSQSFLGSLLHMLMGIAPPFLLYDLSTTPHCYYR